MSFPDGQPSGSFSGPFDAEITDSKGSEASAQRGQTAGARAGAGPAGQAAGTAGAGPALPPGPLDQAAVLELYQAAGALRRGHFVLSSGRHSDTYLQSALVLQWPRLAEALGRALAGPFAGRVDVVAAAAVGGLVIGHEIARELGVRMVFAERAGAVMRLRRSFALHQGERALLAEDVVTTGGSAREVGELVAAAGAVPVGLAAIVDRRSEPAEGSLSAVALARVAAASWDPADCPLCQAGDAPESPGSRRLAGHTP
jgi:orotate phosphoribosyltransferase